MFPPSFLFLLGLIEWFNRWVMLCGRSVMTSYDWEEINFSRTVWHFIWKNIFWQDEWMVLDRPSIPITYEWPLNNSFNYNNNMRISSFQKQNNNKHKNIACKMQVDKKKWENFQTHFTIKQFKAIKFYWLDRWCHNVLKIDFCPPTHTKKDLQERSIFCRCTQKPIIRL